MKLGKVIGKVVSSTKTGNIDGHTILLVEYLNAELKPSGKTAACIDTVNAGAGETVMLCSSSSARFTATTRSVATDNTIIGIVDTISANKKSIYSKSQD
jgi:microcompartment protein CcmK/EutM